MRNARRMMTLTAVVLALGTLLAPGSARAAVFFAGQLNEKGEFIPDNELKGPCFAVRYCTISTDISGGRARTKVEEEITSPAKAPVRAVCIIPLPEGVKKGDATFSLQPPNALDPTARYLDAAEAQKLYEAIAKGTGAAHIVALSGRPALLVPLISLTDKLRVIVEFSRPVKESAGVSEYECPMPSPAFAVGPVARLTMNITVKDAKPLRAVFSPTHEVAVERKGLYEATARFAADDWFGAAGAAFKFLYVADETPLGLRVMAHRAEDEPEGYFIILANPTGDPKGDKVIEKDVLFALDASGSMRGDKMEQARSAIEYCLKNLNPGDRFNIVTFGTEVKSFRENLVAKTDASLKAASAFVDDVVPVGRTNISGALAKGLAGLPEKGRPRIMIFLTDGTPTEGELVPENILKALPELNSSKTKIFVMGVGNDVNAHLLDGIAEQTEGASEYVAPDEEIDVKVAALYNRLSHPVLTNVELAFGELMTNSVYPKKPPALFKGSQVLITGRYRGGGTHTVSLSGSLAGEPVTYTCKTDFPEKAAPANEYVAPLWAARKIGYLLQEIRLHGENKELIDEIIALSRKFGIITEYTEFIATAAGTLAPAAVREEAEKRMKAARAEASGQWAVHQALNDRELQQRAVVGDAANTYRDRRGNLQRSDNVRQIGRRTFYLRDGKWDEADEAGARTVREVKMFSPEYFELVRKNADFRNAQSINAEMSINVGGERIMVKK